MIDLAAIRARVEAIGALENPYFGPDIRALLAVAEAAGRVLEIAPHGHVPEMSRSLSAAIDALRATMGKSTGKV